MSQSAPQDGNVWPHDCCALLRLLLCACCVPLLSACCSCPLMHAATSHVAWGATSPKAVRPLSPRWLQTVRQLTRQATPICWTVLSPGYLALLHRCLNTTHCCNCAGLLSCLPASSCPPNSLCHLVPKGEEASLAIHTCVAVLSLCIWLSCLPTAP